MHTRIASSHARNSNLHTPPHKIENDAAAGGGGGSGRQ
jgi:hypothetical protein